MFDRCWRWRKRLQRRADGSLSARQVGALDDHLSQCARCRSVAAADRALRDTLRTHTGLLEDCRAEAFDDRVVSLLHNRKAQPPVGRSLAGWLSTGIRRSQSLGFLYQIAAGATVAAGLTALCLTPALHPGAATTDYRISGAQPLPSPPPIPLESLLQTTSPTAALLWAAPRAHNTPRELAPAHRRPPIEAKDRRPRQEMPSLENTMG